VAFFYQKIMRFHELPRVLLDTEYAIWTYDMIPDTDLSHTEPSHTKELP